MAQQRCDFAFRHIATKQISLRNRAAPRILARGHPIFVRQFMRRLFPGDAFLRFTIQDSVGFL